MEDVRSTYNLLEQIKKANCGAYKFVHNSKHFETLSELNDRCFFELLERIAEDKWNEVIKDLESDYNDEV